MAIDVRGNLESFRIVFQMLEQIVQAYEDFDYYKDTRYRNIARPAIFWPDGKSLGYGYASHMSGSAQKFYDKFKYWGFADLEDFYCLPIEKRNEFLANGRAIWDATFGEKQFAEKTFEDAIRIDALDNEKKEETLRSLKKAEETFHVKLVEEAKRIKKECYNNRRLRWRIRNEKARFKAEDKLRERTRHSFGGSDLFDEIVLKCFEFQEGLKTLVALRERFSW